MKLSLLRYCLLAIPLVALLVARVAVASLALLVQRSHRSPPRRLRLRSHQRLCQALRNPLRKNHRPRRSHSRRSKTAAHSWIPPI
jgi:hypothetical protein